MGDKGAYKEPQQSFAEPVNVIESMDKLSENATNAKYKKSWLMGNDSDSYTEIFKKINEVKSEHSSKATDRTKVATLLGGVQTLCKNYLITHPKPKSSAKKTDAN